MPVLGNVPHVDEIDAHRVITVVNYPRHAAEVEPGEVDLDAVNGRPGHPSCPVLHPRRARF